MSITLYFDELLEGMNDLLKRADSHLFTSPGNSSILPTSSTQAKWKYAKGPNFLRLHDGQKVYSFHLPAGASDEEEFEAHRLADHKAEEFEEGAESKGHAQVHRSDPGSIYFTLQEGNKNPTYTFKHTGESKWRGIPKKRKSKDAVMHNIDVAAMQEGFKAAYDTELKKKEKTAGPINWLGGEGANLAQRIALAPGEAVYRMGGGNGAADSSNTLLGTAALAGLGALGGLGYHAAKKTLYNTPEENEEENDQGLSVLLKRMGIPAVGLGLMGGAEASLFKKRYEDLATGAGGASNVVTT